MLSSNQKTLCRATLTVLVSTLACAVSTSALAQMVTTTSSQGTTRIAQANPGKVNKLKAKQSKASASASSTKDEKTTEIAVRTPAKADTNCYIQTPNNAKNAHLLRFIFPRITRGEYADHECVDEKVVPEPTPELQSFERRIMPKFKKPGKPGAGVSGVPNFPEGLPE